MRKSAPNMKAVRPPAKITRVPSAESFRVISASPETHRRLSPELRGGILQAPWPNHALQPTPWIAAAFPSRLVRRGSFLFRWTDGPAFNSPEGLAV
jgi:hypothetical protein